MEKEDSKYCKIKIIILKREDTMKGIIREIESKLYNAYSMFWSYYYSSGYFSCKNKYNSFLMRSESFIQV
ncbi:hypothetical protein [Asaccharospora irregularis]|uniref:hypothetical protein n=1 Tax=Asaccharospora irregularis TaxID=29359 RepID=UPI0031DA5CE3